VFPQKKEKGEEKMGRFYVRWLLLEEVGEHL
jgi:hypothetical protein